MFESDSGAGAKKEDFFCDTTGGGQKNKVFDLGLHLQ
jgi:hypothetical protein